MRQLTILREAVINGSYAYIIDSDNLKQPELSQFIKEKEIGIIIYNSYEKIFNSNQEFRGREIDLKDVCDQDTAQQLFFCTNSIREYIKSSRNLRGENQNFTNVLFLLRRLDENYLQLFALYVDQMNMQRTDCIHQISQEYQRLLQQWDDVEQKLNKFIQKRSASTNTNTTQPAQSLVLDFPPIFNQSEIMQPPIITNLSPVQSLNPEPISLEQQSQILMKKRIENAFNLPPPIVIPQFIRKSLK